MDKEFQLHRDHFQSIRKQLTDSEIQNVGNELKIAFNKLEDTSSTIQQIPTLLYICGTRVEYNHDQMRSFDLAKAVNCQRLMRNSNIDTRSGNSNNIQSLKPCRDGADCSLHHDGDIQHNEYYSHPCRWLDLCRNINENEHLRHYTHSIDGIKECRRGTDHCPELGDPEHRRTYRHVVSNTKQECKYGSSCREQSDPTHCNQFHHPTRTSLFVAPATTGGQSSNGNTNSTRSSRIHTNHGDDDIQREHNTKGSVNSGGFSQPHQTTIRNMREDPVTVSPFSNRKQECKYGTSCREQSDPRHCDHFHHPTRTSLFVPSATASSHLSNMNSDTTRSSRIHTNHGDNGMQKAYSIGGAIALERLSQQDQTTIKNMREDAVIVVPGTYDHIDQVLTKLNLKFTTVQQYELMNYPLKTYQTVYINCASNFPREAAYRLREFVEKGLHIITTDWALRNVLQVAFSDFVTHNGKSTHDEVVGIEVVDPNHAFVNGFILAATHAEPQWWLETGSHPIEIVDKKRVKVLIRSQALYDKYQSDAVIVTFDCGQGNVTHMISHFYLQRSDTPNARHKMSAQQYAQDIKASDNITKLISKDGQNLNYAQIQSSATSAQFIYNLVSNRLNSTNQSTSSTHSRKNFQ
ncbi:unnamed protein product [Rotaria sp. Silwood1]|nr:unnamed protein product [Rotaria sp. Silwood1]